MNGGGFLLMNGGGFLLINGGGVVRMNVAGRYDDNDTGLGGGCNVEAG